ncbi:Di-and tricarboxylate transporter [Vibrio vulnificus]|nr:Di-and tricarboxylate transporter [Vibrio vulnificus]
MVTLWVLGPTLGIHATVTALIGLVFLLLSRTITWDAVLSEKEAWHTITWFAVLIMMASELNKLGFIKWFSNGIGESLSGFGWATTIILLLLVYYYSHYLMASAMAHISAMYSAFLAIAISAGAPPCWLRLCWVFLVTCICRPPTTRLAPRRFYLALDSTAYRTGGRSALSSHSSLSPFSSLSEVCGGKCSAFGNKGAKKRCTTGLKRPVFSFVIFISSSLCTMASRTSVTCSP